MRTRDAWLAVLAATLGISEEACRNDAVPVAAREVASTSAIAPSASVEMVPAAIASVTAVASASASATATASAAPASSAPAIPTTGSIGLIGAGIGPTGRYASCGVSTRDLAGTAGPHAEVNVTVGGGAAGDDRIMASLRARLRSCANQALNQNPTQRGRLVVMANIGANGAVTSASIATNTGLSEPCGACMLRAIQSRAFPAGAERTLRIVIDQSVQSP